MEPHVTTQANKMPGDRNNVRLRVFTQNVIIAFQVEVDSFAGKQVTIIAAKVVTHSTMIVVPQIILLYCLAGIPPTASQDTQHSIYVVPDPP